MLELNKWCAKKQIYFTIVIQGKKRFCSQLLFSEGTVSTDFPKLNVKCYMADHYTKISHQRMQAKRRQVRRAQMTNAYTTNCKFTAYSEPSICLKYIFSFKAFLFPERLGKYELTQNVSEKLLTVTRPLMAHNSKSICLTFKMITDVLLNILLAI